MPMSLGSNGTSSLTSVGGGGRFVGSKPARCMDNLPIKKYCSVVLYFFTLNFLERTVRIMSAPPAWHTSSVKLYKLDWCLRPFWVTFLCF
jgi:hypothetical protein